MGPVPYSLIFYKVTTVFHWSIISYWKTRSCFHTRNHRLMHSKRNQLHKAIYEKLRSTRYFLVRRRSHDRANWKYISVSLSPLAEVLGTGDIPRKGGRRATGGQGAVRYGRWSTGSGWIVFLDVLNERAQLSLYFVHPKIVVGARLNFR